MKNPVIIYALIRLAIFGAILTIFLLLGFNGIFASFVSAALALAASLIFLGKQRDQASSKLYDAVRNSKKDRDSQAEDSEDV